MAGAAGAVAMEAVATAAMVTWAMAAAAGAVAMDTVATAATVTWAMAAAAGAVAMETVATAAMAAMAGKMTAATERDRLTPSPTAGSRGSDARPLGPTMGGRPDRTCGERPRASRIAYLRSDQPNSHRYRPATMKLRLRGFTALIDRGHARSGSRSGIPPASQCSENWREVNPKYIASALMFGL